jgi:hypothetical protein
VSLDPTYRDGFGRPLLRMTFDWNENEIKASQFLVAKAREMSRTLSPVSMTGDAPTPFRRITATTRPVPFSKCADSRQVVIR